MILLVRHGEAAAGWGTHQDPALSETGNQQAAAIAEELAYFDCSHIISSPMQRCQETAKYFSQRSGLPVNIDRAVSQIPTPPGLEDRTSWLKDLMSGTWESAPRLVLNWRRDLLKKLATLPEDCVVFSHFVAINAIVGALEKSDNVMLFKPGHCSMTIIRRGISGPRLVKRGSESATKIL